MGRSNRQPRFCGGCGQLEPWWEHYTRRAKVAAFANAAGRVPAWYAYACSDACLAVTQEHIRQDDAARLALGVFG